MMSKFSNLLLSFCLFFAVISCKNSDSSSVTDNNSTTPYWGNNVAKSEIKWESNTVVFSGADLSDIKSIDSANYTFNFKSSSTKAKSLQVGQVIVIGDYAFRKISDVNNLGSTIQVITEEITLAEAATDADFEWDVEVNPSQNQIMQSLSSKGYKITKISLDSFAITLKIGSYELSGWVKKVPNQTLVQITISKEIGGIKAASLIVDGTFNRFRSKGKYRMKAKQLEEWE